MCKAGLKESKTRKDKQVERLVRCTRLRREEGDKRLSGREVLRTVVR